MANFLMALNKCPGVRPIGIAEIWRQILVTYVLKVAGAMRKDACRNAQLRAGLKAGIEGVVHAACALFTKRDHEEERVFLLVNDANTFNAGNRIACLWTVRHRWPSGEWFIMNCYRHQALLMVYADDECTGHWLVRQ